MTRDTTLLLYDPETDREFDATVTWCLSGKYLPASYWHPEETPDLEIESVTDDETGEDITNTYDEIAADMIWDMICDRRIDV